MAHRKRRCWCWRRSLFSFVFLCTSWTLVGRWALCKPMIQDQHPPDVVNGQAWPRIIDDEWTASEQGTQSTVSSLDTIARLDQLRKTMEAFKRLRLTLSERLLANGAANVQENFMFSDVTPSSQAGRSVEAVTEKRRRNFVLLAGMDEADDASSNHFVLNPDTESLAPAKQRKRNNRHRNRQRRQRHRMRTLSRNQRELDERIGSELVERAMQDDGGASYQKRIQGLQVTANVQQSTGSVEALRIAQRQKQDATRILVAMTKSEYECPKLHGKTTQVLCPSRRRGYRVCIPDAALCNGRVDCPLAEDEDPVNCLFYKTTVHHFRLIVDAVVELSDVVKKHESRHSMDEL